MNSLQDILNIICSEAAEYAGIPEVPDNQLGATQYYHSPKRDARHGGDHGEHNHNSALPSIRYNLEVIQNDDGSLSWEE